MLKFIKKFLPKQQVKERVVTIGGDSFLANAILGTTGSVSASQAMQYYRDNAAVATAVDLIAQSVEQISPILEDNNGELISAHAILEHLAIPNGFDTWQEFIGQVSRHYLLTADSEIYSVGTVTRPPIQTFAVKPQNITITEDFNDGYPRQYVVSSGVGRGTYVRDEQINKATRFYDGSMKELYHIMGFSSNGNNITGDSVLSAAAMDIKQQRLESLKKRFFRESYG